MIENRSAPPGSTVPVLSYADVAKAIDWLCGAFGFTERLRTRPETDGTIHRAQLARGDAGVVLTGVPPGEGPGRFIDAVMIRVENIDAHYERAKQFGAQILLEPKSHMFGERQYSAIDLAGNRWNFTESVADVWPEDWGGIVNDVRYRCGRRPRPSFCYLQIPAVDLEASAAFYASVFGWNIRRHSDGHPSFDDAAGNISGAWVTGRPPSREPGLLPYIWVDDIAASLERIAKHGGEVVETAHPDNPGSTSNIATFRDPAGNVLGLYQEAAR
jgi:predicted enzyme related to lactoylglutathione lyase